MIAFLDISPYWSRKVYIGLEVPSGDMQHASPVCFALQAPVAAGVSAGSLGCDLGGRAARVREEKESAYPWWVAVRRLQAKA